MQAYKIKKMSVKRINQWLSAIGKLLKHYEGKVGVYTCPLCDVPTRVGCDYCLWKIIEGNHCEDFARELYGDDADPGELRENLRFKRWKIVRLGQLKNWKKILKLELARRDV